MASERKPLTASEEKRLADTMKTLDMTREEVLEMWDEDKEIDRGAKLHELDPELEAGAKKARQAERKSNSTTKRERKENPDKRFLIETLKNAVGEIAEDAVEVTNVEREMLFHYNGVKYKIVLSAPRS